jgi:hypothetical protein
MGIRKIFSRRKTREKTIEQHVEETYKRNPIVFDRLAEL